jgi:uncharacterized membrane protein
MAEERTTEQEGTAAGQRAQSTGAADIPGGRLGSHARLASVDFLRGSVMILMALDHTRDFFHYCGFYSPCDPTDLSRTYTALFVTRWVTHFCAPVFVFLAGAGAFLSGSRGKSKSDLSIFLLTRGLFLILLELTVVRVSWWFNFDFRFEGGQVIWALGWSMILLAGLIFLSARTVTVFAVAMIAVHNLFDGLRAQDLGALDWVWKILHEFSLIQPTPRTAFAVAYPLIPWMGVMAAGYGFGRLLLLERGTRRKTLLILGAGLVLLFVIIRATNLYGDPRPWSSQKSTLFTVFSFLNTEKYPPSLLFLLMTLGPAIAALSMPDRELGRLTRPVIVFGRVPLFFYLLHLPLIHGLAVLIARLRYGQAEWLFSNPPWLPGVTPVRIPEAYGFGLPVVYLIWFGIVLALYPVCAWYAGVKKRRRDAWLSYV